VERIEELPAVGVIVGAPDERALARPAARLAGGLLRPVAPAEEIAVAHRVIACVERLALPGELERAFGYAALVAGVAVDGTPALRRPRHDLDLEGVRLVDQAAVAGKTRRARDDERRVVDAAHAGRGHVGDGVWINVHGVSTSVRPWRRIMHRAGGLPARSGCA